MNNEQWHQWRKGGIGSSDAAVIKKLFPFGKTPYQLWEQRMKGEITYENKAMSHGKKYEERALNWFEKKMNCVLFRQIAVENDKRDWIRATLDGYDFDQQILVEAKCPYNLDNHRMIKKTKKIPEIYYPQCQHQLIASEGKYGKIPGSYFFSYNYEDEEDSIIIENPRNDSYIRELITEENAFWNCIVNGIPPELTERDFPKNLISMEGHERWKKLAWRLSKIKQYAKQEEEIKKEMLMIAGEKECMGHGISMTQSKGSESIDYKQVKIDHPEIDWDSYKKIGSPKWTFRATS